MENGIPIFWDMDGTWVDFRYADMEELMSPGFFLNGNPNENMIAAARILAKEHPSYVASKVLSEQAKEEKSLWIDRFIPEIRKENRFFIPYDLDKTSGIPMEIRPYYILIDDNNEHGLNGWKGLGIKVLNGINNTNRSWTGYIVSNQQRPEIIAATIDLISRYEKEKWEEKGGAFE